MISKDLSRAICRGEFRKLRCNRVAQELLVEWLENQETSYDIGLMVDTELATKQINAFADYLREKRPFRREQDFRTVINMLCELFSIPKTDVKKEGYSSHIPPDEGKAPIPLRPCKCNLCGGEVILMSNANIYGREYGSGKCYYCAQCHAFVGTHKPPWPDIAMGLLADQSMRNGKKYCHALFDPLWMNEKKKKQQKRNALYRWLTKQMGLPEEMGHFGYFDIHQLRQAYRVLITVKDKAPVFDEKCNAVIGFSEKHMQ